MKKERLWGEKEQKELEKNGIYTVQLDDEIKEMIKELYKEGDEDD